MTKTVAIYARTCSTETQTIEAQVNECMAAVKQKYGEQVQVEVYADQGISGQAMFKLALGSLLRNAATKKFTAVMVTGLNRVNRTPQALEVVYQLLRNHVDFIGVRDDLHFKHDDTRTLTMLTFLEFESMRHGLRIKNGLQRQKVNQKASI